MDLYYNRLASVPMRKEANHRSEMISELICGEPFKVIQQDKDWIKIQTKLDSYTAWIAANQFVPFTEPATVLIDQVQFFDDDQRLIGYMSGYLPASQAKKTTSLQVQQTYSIQQLVETTRLWLNTPYLWGGKTIHGVDCSGFVQMLYRQLNIQLPRDAYQQVSQGADRNWEDRRAGDLAFFEEKERITHVGILIDTDRIIHASGWVRIDSIDKKGILHNGNYTHELSQIKNLRIFD